MSGKAVIKIEADTADGEKGLQQLVKHMEKQKAEIERANEANKKLREENKRQAEEFKQQSREKSENNRRLLAETKEQTRAQVDFGQQAAAAWSRFGTSIMTTAGGFVSVNTLLAEANRYLERQSKLQQEIHARAMSLGQAQSNTAINFAGLSEADRKAASGIAGRVNLRQGFGNRPALESAAGSLISAGATPEGAEQTLDFAAAIAPGNAQLVESLSSGIVDLQGSTGMSMPEASGLLLSSAAGARVKDPAQVSKALAKVTSNASALFDAGGKSLAGEEAAALWAVMTKMRGDVSGDESATLASNALTKLSTFKGFGPAGPNTIMGRINALQADPVLAQQFIAHGGYDTQDPAVGRLLTDKNFGYARMLEETDKTVGYDPSLGGAIAQLHRSQPNIEIMKSQNRLEALSEAGDQANLVESRIATAEAARLKAHNVLDPITADAVYMGRMQAPGRSFTDLFGSEVERVNVRLQNIQALQTDFTQSPLDITPERREEVSAILKELIEVVREEKAAVEEMTRQTAKPIVQPQGMQEAP